MKKRIISAIILIAIILPLIIIGDLPFTIFMAVFGVCGLYELIGVREKKNKLPMALKLLGYLMVVFITFCNTDAIEFTSVFDYRLVAFLLVLFLIPMVFIDDQKKYSIEDALYLVGSILFIGLSANLIVITRNYDIKYIIYLFLVTIFSDTFALVTGLLVGQNKLCPNISPKKTIEGLIGGVLMGTFVAVAFYHTVINPQLPLVIITLITMLLSIVSQLGDLVFSSIKRYYDVKDFSNIIPGHGGVLDRFDSLVFVVFVFVMFIGIL